VANLEGPEEELVAEDSPIRDCPHGWSIKRTVVALCLLPLKCCVTWEHCCVAVDFSHAWQKRISPSEGNTSLKSLTYWHKRELAICINFPVLVN
jgi:hypothetical protein